mgnify:CR=1 FL=1
MIYTKCTICSGRMVFEGNEVGWIHFRPSDDIHCTGILQGCSVKTGGFYSNPLVMQNGELYIGGEE